MKFSVKDFFSKCDQIPGAFTEEILMENFIHYALYGDLLERFYAVFFEQIPSYV